MNTKKMYHKTGWTRSRLALIAALPVITILPIASRATALEAAAETDQAGTEFRKCTDSSWANYNDCLMSADHGWERTLCDVVFQADVTWCGSVYYKRIKTGT